MGKCTDTESRSVVVRGRGRGVGECLLMIWEFLFWGDVNILESAVMIAQL